MRKHRYTHAAFWWLSICKRKWTNERTKKRRGIDLHRSHLLSRPLDGKITRIFLRITDNQWIFPRISSDFRWFSIAFCCGRLATTRGAFSKRKWPRNSLSLGSITCPYLGWDLREFHPQIPLPLPWWIPMYLNQSWDVESHTLWTPIPHVLLPPTKRAVRGLKKNRKMKKKKIRIAILSYARFAFNLGS